MLNLDDRVKRYKVVGDVRTVLVIDDDEALRLLIHNILEPDYLVFDAADANGALEQIVASDFDAILLDHHLGGRSGLDLLVELREDRKVDSAIIFMTSDTSRDLATQAFRENADDFIGKPINRQLFKYAVSEALKKRDTQRQLQQAVAKAEIDEMKNLIIALASRELHTPLIPLIGLSSALYKQNEADTLDKDVLSDGLKRIAEAARQLNEIIGDILEVAAMNKGAQPLQREDTNLRTLIEGLRLEFRDAAEDKGLRLFVTMPDGGHSLFVDGKRLVQAMRFIVDNAIKFTEFGTVEIGLSYGVDDVVFFVSDTGAGIVPEYTARLFESFEKVDMKSGMSPGLGVGLYLCRRIVETMLGGTIEVESTFGRGSRFQIRIPKPPPA
ncbi:MAG: hybrid sensor histidine kinase/response regulator [Candidatus Magnetominusculus sp. LBB02]|nr:hybrid sensor histidine kinase/response regulator [Candidatus Magnetominusculus sp. LBB02]